MGITGLNNFLRMYCLDKKNDEIISAAKIRDIKILHYWIEESKCLALEFKRAKKIQTLFDFYCLIILCCVICKMVKAQLSGTGHWPSNQ